MPRNSAPPTIQVQATEKKVSTSHSAACTGLRAAIVASAAMAAVAAKPRKASVAKSIVMRVFASTERRVGGAAFGDFRLEPVADGQQLRLGHDVLAALVEVVFVDVRLDDGIHRAAFLAEAAEDALEQVDVVARGAAGAVGALFGIDGDRKRRAH